MTIEDWLKFSENRYKATIGLAQVRQYSCTQGTSLNLWNYPQFAVIPQDIKMTRVNLVDSNGQMVITDKWYKIVLADGRELGFGVTDKNRQSCAPVPSGEGVVFRYRRNHNENDHTHYGWPIGEIGYLKGLDVTYNGQRVIKHLSLSNGSPPILAWYNTDDSYGFVAKQLPGNRVALYAHDQYETVAGLKDQHVGDGLSIHGTQGSFPIAFDCAIVEVGPYDANNMYF